MKKKSITKSVQRITKSVQSVQSVQKDFEKCTKKPYKIVS